MKFLFLLAFLFPILALADIYKSVDDDGHVTYSSAPLKGAKRIVMTTQNRTGTEHTRVGNTPQDFPKVNQATQKVRDDTRRKILEDELKSEQDLLNTAKQQAAQRPKDEHPNELAKQINSHLENITAIKTELFRLK